MSGQVWVCMTHLLLGVTINLIYFGSSISQNSLVDFFWCPLVIGGGSCMIRRIVHTNSQVCTVPPWRTTRSLSAASLQLTAMRMLWQFGSRSWSLSTCRPLKFQSQGSGISGLYVRLLAHRGDVHVVPPRGASCSRGLALGRSVPWWSNQGWHHMQQPSRMCKPGACLGYMADGAAWVGWSTYAAATRCRASPTRPSWESPAIYGGLVGCIGFGRGHLPQHHLLRLWWPL